MEMDGLGECGEPYIACSPIGLYLVYEPRAGEPSGVISETGDPAR